MSRNFSVAGCRYIQYTEMPECRRDVLCQYGLHEEMLIGILRNTLRLLCCPARDTGFFRYGLSATHKIWGVERTILTLLSCTMSRVFSSMACHRRYTHMVNRSSAFSFSNHSRKSMYSSLEFRSNDLIILGKLPWTFSIPHSFKIVDSAYVRCENMDNNVS